MTTAHRMTDTQVNALAAYIAADSEARWDAPGVRAWLRRRRDHIDATTLAIATLRAAADPRNRTPAVLGFPENRCYDIDAQPNCTEHGPAPRRPDGECAGCYADRTGVMGRGSLMDFPASSEVTKPDTTGVHA